MTLAEIKAAAEAALTGVLKADPETVALARHCLWLGKQVEELHKVSTVLLGAYGRCATYTLDDLHLSREEREWVDRVLAETREP